MKLLNVTHKNIRYEFRLLESVKVVEITKGDLFTYLMKWNGHLFICDCPGATYHKKCWHTGIVELFDFVESIKEPWAEWAEEGGEMMYGS